MNNIVQTAKYNKYIPVTSPIVASSFFSSGAGVEFDSSLMRPISVVVSLFEGEVLSEESAIAAAGEESTLIVTSPSFAALGVSLYCQRNIR